MFNDSHQNYNAPSKGKIGNKDDFLKKMKIDKKKEEQKQIKEQATLKIINFIKGLIFTSNELKSLSTKISTIVGATLNSNKYNEKQKEKITLTVSKYIKFRLSIN